MEVDSGLGGDFHLHLQNQPLDPKLENPVHLQSRACVGCRLLREGPANQIALDVQIQPGTCTALTLIQLLCVDSSACRQASKFQEGAKIQRNLCASSGWTLPILIHDTAH